MTLLYTVLCATAMMAASPGGQGYFSNVPLITQDGKVVHFYDDLLKGKSVVINLIYTHCSASCPLETAKLSQVQRILGDRVGKDIFFYSISIDPMQDSPQVLKAYADKFHVGKGWLFLTGKKEDIGQISKQLGLASLTDLSNPDGHLPALMIGKEATNQWMRNSAVDNPQFLAMTILHFLDGYKATKPPSYADIGALPNVGRGEYLFKSRCAACHTIGKGDRVGPDLLNVTASRDHAWLARYVAAPDRVLASGDPIARKLFTKYRDVRMPNLSLSAEDVQALLPFIEQQSRALATSGSTNFVLVAADGRATAPFLPCTTATLSTTIDGGTLAVSKAGYAANFKTTESQNGSAMQMLYQDAGRLSVNGNTYTLRSPRAGTFTGTLSGGLLTISDYRYCGTRHTLTYQ